MRAREIGDIDGDVMAVVARDLFSGLAEDQALRGANFHLGDGHVHILGQGIRGIHDLFIELADTRSRPWRNQEFNIWNPQGHLTELRPRCMDTEMVPPWADDVDMAILGLASELGPV